MANHKSAEKRNRQNAKRSERNKGYRTQIKNATKRVLAQVEENNQENARAELKRAEKIIAKVAGKGVIHNRAASRKISNLTLRVQKMSVSA